MKSADLLMVMMEPPSSMEEEFNDWYDTEHFPQRASLPGFLTASRWVCLDGWPKWLAVYDLESIAVLQRPEYVAVAGPNGTPWSKRVLPRTVGRRRIVATSMSEQPAHLTKQERTPFLTVAGWSSDYLHAAVSAANSLGEKLKGTGAAEFFRVFTAPAQDRLDVWALIGATSPARDKAVREATEHALADEHMHVLNRYVPYIRARSE